ncbi:MAG: right-handed parallel beta-helix repeat-containing protein, partial [Thermoplasmata archaeon]|nr:right-handed parallel beta-helix repeat-containing protein [Thermoplasmata archaeon]
MKKAIIACMFFVLASSVAIPLSTKNIQNDGRAQIIDFVDGLKIYKHKVTPEELVSIKETVGTYEEGKNYNVKIDGHGTGLAPPTAEKWDEIAQNLYVVDSIAIDGALPTSVDNSQDIWFPPIGNQDGEGSCVCFAVAYYTKTYQEAKEHGWDLSDVVWVGGYYGEPNKKQDKIMSPDFVYHQILYWTGSDDGGSTYFDAMELIEKIGCASWQRMPYDPTDSTSWPSEEAWREAPLYRADSGYNWAWATTNAELNNLKTLLANDNLAVISINAYYYSDLYDTPDGDLWTVDNYNPLGTNHANVIVGYDDNFGPYIEEGVTRYGAFKVANSWGTGWAGDHDNDGFYWISYEAMKRRVQYYMFMIDKTAYEPHLLASFEISHNDRTQCDIYVGMGSTSSPIAEKAFNDWYYGGAPSPFPSNKIVFDITEFMDVASIDGQNFYLKIYDGGDSTTGTLLNFSIEYFDTYNSNVAGDIISISPDPPVSTVNNANVYAQTTFNLISTPTVETLSATNVGGYSAQLNGNLASLGGDTSSQVWFVYDVISHASWQDYAFNATKQTMASTGTFNAVITGLTPGTTYYYRAVASNAGGTAQGDEISFSTTPSVVYVDDDYSTATPGWGYDHFASIQDGINAVLDRGKVIVYAGLYNENVIVNKEVNVIGENASLVTVDGGGTGDVFAIVANNVSISNITARNGGEEGIYVEGAANINISNCIIAFNGDCGILLNQSTNVSVFGNIIHNNSFDGILLYYSSGNKIVGNTVYWNGIGNNGEGILLMYSNSNYIAKNEAYENGETGIILEPNSSNNNVSSNTAYNNADCGILISTGSNGNIIFNNTAYGNTFDGILVESSQDNSIIGNVIYDNGEDGISLLSSATNCIIKGNIVYSNNAGISLHNVWNHSIIGNHVYGNSGEGIVLWDNSHNITVSGNNIHDNQWGIEVGLNCHDNKLLDNEVYSNNYGIEIDNSSYITIQNNSVYANNDYGIELV